MIINTMQYSIISGMIELMEKETISFRLDVEKKTALDLIAESMDRDRSFIITEAISTYLDFYKIEEKEIQDRLQKAKAGDIASEKEVKMAFSKWKK